MSESTPIQIHVLSEIRKEHEQDKDTIEVHTTGERFLKGNNVYLRYDEEHELGSVKTTVKIGPEEIMIMRSGAVAMKQRFIQGQKTVTDYATPFGKLQLEINTNSLTIDKTELEDRLVILYDLQIDENEKHVHKLMMTYKEDKK